MAADARASGAGRRGNRGGRPCAWALGKLVQAQLYGVSPHDPASLALPSVLLAAVALLAG